MKEAKEKIYRAMMFLAAHPDNKDGSEMNDRLEDLMDIYGKIK